MKWEIRKKVKRETIEKQSSLETGIIKPAESLKIKNDDDDDPGSVDVLNSPYLCFLEVREGYRIFDYSLNPQD